MASHATGCDGVEQFTDNGHLSISQTLNTNFNWAIMWGDESDISLWHSYVEYQN